MEKISIVVTVYNVEPYIEKCLRSILGQTYRNIEVIIVDDGSTDHSREICDDIAGKDSRATVLHQQNQGPILARLNGVMQATADYITFVDADDWIDPNLYQDIVNTGALGKVDLISFGLIRHRGDHDEFEEACDFAGGIYDIARIEKEILPGVFWNIEKRKYGLDPSLWSKIFKRKQLLAQLRIISELSIHYGEDIAVLYPLILQADSLLIVEKCYYYHRLRKNNQIPPYIADEEYLKKLHRLYQYLKSEFEKSAYQKVLIKQLDYFYIYSAQMSKWKYGDLALEEEYLFPFDKVEKGCRLVLYGAGRVGQTFYKQLEKLNFCKVVGWVDRDFAIYGREEIQAIGSLQDMEFDYILVAIEAKSTSDIVKQNLCNMGIEKEKIILL